MMIFKRLLEYEGLEPDRFQVRWISGAEAGKFRDTVMSVVEQVRALGPLNLTREIPAFDLPPIPDDDAAGLAAAEAEPEEVTL